MKMKREHQVYIISKMFEKENKHEILGLSNLFKDLGMTPKEFRNALLIRYKLNKWIHDELLPYMTLTEVEEEFREILKKLSFNWAGK